MNKWIVDIKKLLPPENSECLCRNMPGLKSESGSSGKITFKYKDGSAITINRKD